MSTSNQKQTIINTPRDANKMTCACHGRQPIDLFSPIGGAIGESQLPWDHVRRAFITTPTHRLTDEKGSDYPY